MTALGPSRTQTWQNLLAGHSGISRYSIFKDHPNQLLGMLGDKPASLEILLKSSVTEALVDAQLDSLPSQVGFVIGSSRGNQSELEMVGRGEISLDHWLNHYQSSPSAMAAKILNVQGPLLAPRAACATGLWAIAQGADLIRHGLVDVVIAGGVEAPISPLSIAGFQKMGALTSQSAAPFDIDRSGFVLGEGAAIFVLESLDHARERDQLPYGQILGFGSSADGYHVSAPNPESVTAQIAVEQCLERSYISAKEIELIHTHGTGTRLNDVNESSIIKKLFPHNPLCTSSKGALGHTLGASGSIGSALCLLAFKHQSIPPCTGLKQRDPQCEIHLVQASTPNDPQHALCLSFGFGGQNAALAFSKVVS